MSQANEQDPVSINMEQPQLQVKNPRDSLQSTVRSDNSKVSGSEAMPPEQADQANRSFIQSMMIQETTFNILSVLSPGGSRPGYTPDGANASVSITSRPSDTSYLVNTTGHELTWTARDSSCLLFDCPDTYTIRQNGSEIQTGSWASNSPVTHSIDGLEVGIYNFTIYFVDQAGDYDLDTVFVTVYDPIPQLQYSNNDFTLQYYNSTTLTWNVTDNNPSHYELYVDQALIQASSWVSGQNLSINLENLDPGIYNYTMVFIDQSNQQVDDMVQIEVIDDLNPVITHNQNNYTYSEGTMGHILNLTATDDYPGALNIYRNGSLSKSAWVSNVAVEYNIDGLTKGIYNFTVVFLDGSKNTVKSEIWITVIDSTAPILTSSSGNTSYVISTTGHVLSWTFEDNYEWNYTLYNNSIFLRSGMWVSGNSIELNIDGLGIGEYNFTIVIADESGNISVDSSFVRVTDNPVFISTPEKLLLNDTSMLLHWNVSDTNPQNYSIFLDAQLVKSGMWSNYEILELNMSGFGIGTYNVTVVIQDDSGLRTSNQLDLVINDRPYFELSPVDQVIEEMQNSLILNWTASDSNPAGYSLWINSSLVRQDEPWSSGQLISLDFSSYLKGEYNITIMLNDQNGTVISHSVWVSVVDASPPVINSVPSNSSYEYETTGHLLSWSALDNYPGIYILYNNSQPILTDNWLNNTALVLSIDGLVLGTYNFTMVFYDQSGNTAKYTIWITVYDLPQYISYPDQYFLNDSSILLQWQVTDTNPGNYSFLIDGTLQEFGNWSDLETLVFSLNGYGVGTYNATLVIEDQTSIKVTSSLQITINDPPWLNIQPMDTSIAEINNTLILNWTAYDSNPLEFNITINGVLLPEYINQLWTSGELIQLDLSTLEKGNYVIAIIFVDQNSTVLSDTVTVEIYDGTPPQLSRMPADHSYQINSINNFLVWTAEDKYPDYYELYNNSQLIRTGAWLSGTDITLRVDGLDLGSYNFTIILYDHSTNHLIHQLNLDVVDELDPLIKVSNLVFDENTTNKTVLLVITDDSRLNISAFLNGSLIYNTTDSMASSELGLDFSSLTYGNYNLTLVIIDQGYNEVVDQETITILDTTSPNLLSSVDDQIISISRNEFVVSWNVTDLNAGILELYINNSLVDTMIWSNESLTSIDLIPLIGHNRGSYLINILFLDQAANQVSDSFVLQVVDDISPDIQSEPDDVSVPLINNTVELTWSVFDHYPKQFNVYVNGSLAETQQFSTNENTFVFTLAQNGRYNVTAVFSDQSGLSSRDGVWVEVYIIKTSRPQISPHSPVRSGDSESLSGEWSALENSTDGGIITFQLLDVNSTPVISGTTTINNTWWAFTITYNQVTAGTYTLHLDFTKYGFENQSLNHSIDVEKHRLRIELEHSGDIHQGQEYNITATVLYDEPSTLQLLQYQPVTDQAAGVYILINLEYISIDGSPGHLNHTGYTNTHGQLIWTLESTETDNMRSIRSLSAVVSDTGYYQATDGSVAENDLPEVIEQPLNYFNLIENYLARYTIEIIMVLSSIILVLGGLFFVFYRRRKAKIRREKQLDRAWNEIQSLDSIRSILIQQDAGIPLFRLQVKTIGVDTTLISGMATALSSFMDEISSTRKTTGFQIMEREGLSLTIHSTEKTSILVISDNPLSPILQEQMRGANEEISQDLEHLVDSSQGNIIAFEQVMQVFIKHHFKIPLLNKLTFPQKSQQRLITSSDLSPKDREQLSQFLDIFQTSEARTGGKRLYELLDSLKMHGLDSRRASELILLAYNHQLLVPLYEDHLEPTSIGQLEDSTVDGYLVEDVDDE